MDRPILFSSAMVRALLDGRKTQTRRVLSSKRRLRPNLFDGSWSDGFVLDPGNQSWQEDAYPWRVGDRLWVRESIDKMSERGDDEIGYKADWPGDGAGLGWRPSIHMPRWASRLTLAVTDIRVQRLQDISEDDAEAEGWPAPENRAKTGIAEIRDAYPIGWYAWLWDSINADRPGCSWSDNPWVVAISFTVDRRNIDAGAP